MLISLHPASETSELDFIERINGRFANLGRPREKAEGNAFERIECTETAKRLRRIRRGRLKNGRHATCRAGMCGGRKSKRAPVILRRHVTFVYNRGVVRNMAGEIYEPRISSLEVAEMARR